MATHAVSTTRPEGFDPGPAEPLLEPGDRLSRDEFERRYNAMPEVKKAELIEGVVYMPTPVRWNRHGRPHVGGVSVHSLPVPVRAVGRLPIVGQSAFMLIGRRTP